VAKPSAARRVAFEVLRRVFEHGAFADHVFRSAAQRHGLPRRQRAQAQRLAYGAVQRRGTADHLVSELAGRPPTELDPPLLAALRLGLYELLYAGATPDHAAVDQAVELAKGAKPGRGAGLVNAVLRRVARERAAILDRLEDDGTPERAAVAHSAPGWLVRLWWDELGPADARTLLAAANEPAETALRANVLRSERDELLAALRAEGVRAAAAPGPPPLDAPEGIVVDGPLGEGGARAIDEGAVLPQSRASLAVVALIDPQPGERILDLCAGPGVKTTAIAARMEDRGELVALELDANRAARTADLCRKLGVACARVEVADAASADLGSGYDRVLVDPPCSDLGTLASRPDARWRKSPELIERIAVLQGEILANAAAALRPGGTLVYSTCTISRRENEDVVAAALDDDGSLATDDLGASYGALASPHDRRFLQTRPDRDRTSGFFIARLRREGP
jgi:16S rRNA (cytosine967-C5)-methyltransferase